MTRNLENKSLIGVFVITLFFLLSMPILLPSWRLLFFAPFLVVIYYQKSYTVSLWVSFLCGLFVDLLSSDRHLGMHAIDYSIATWLLYPQRRHFFAENLSTLPLMTLLFSLVSTGVLMGLIAIFEEPLSLSWQWGLTDFLYLPVADGCYAFLLFILPSVLLGRAPRRGQDYFM
jgi:rod shape-determining protein MreD